MTQPDPAGLAVALAYQEEDGAPRVVAKGRGLLAQAIVERARDAGVYVHESPELVALLMQDDLDERINAQEFDHCFVLHPDGSITGRWSDALPREGRNRRLRPPGAPRPPLRHSPHHRRWGRVPPRTARERAPPRRG